MSLDVDIVMDRRRLARRVAFWRGLAILVLIAAVAAGATFAADRAGLLANPHIARIPITGAIVADRPLLTLIETVRKNEDVAGVVLTINSPGGTSVGGERLYNALRDLAEAKPVAAHINGVGASAAYMAALATDHIVAQRTSLTGSIGVLIQYGQINRLLDRIGVSITKLESGPLKAEPTPFEAPTPAAVDLLQGIVDDVFAYFLAIVVERRPLDEAEARDAADGRIFTGAQALEAKLIDEIGNEKTAIAWMERERNLPKDLKVRTYRPEPNTELPIAVRMTDHVLDRVFAAAGASLPQMPDTGSVDGLWSLWQFHEPSDN